jgi:hypothetical protein
MLSRIGRVPMRLGRHVHLRKKFTADERRLEGMNADRGRDASRTFDVSTVAHSAI